MSKQLPNLLRRAGIAKSRSHLKVGALDIEPRPFDEGPTWQDHAAKHALVEGMTRRVRIYRVERGASQEARCSINRAAEREMSILTALDHPGIVRADAMEQHEAGPAIVFRYDPRSVRLDHYMAQYGTQLDLELRLDMASQLADALAYAHGRHVHHRALSARSVYVTAGHGDWRRPRLQIGDWQTAERGVGEAPSSVSRQILPTSHAGEHVERSAEAYLAPELSHPGSDGVALDVFGLGTLTYLIFTGRPPAATRQELLSRLSTTNGLRISGLVDAAPPSLDDLVEEATRPIVSDRLSSAETFQYGLSMVEEELTRPSADPRDPHEADPLDAGPGAVIAGDWRVLRRLGSGSTATAFLVKDPSEKEAVLKIARDEERAARLESEAAVLSRLADSRIVRLRRGPSTVAERTVIVLDHAGETTLARKLRDEGACTIDELERFGDDLFAAIDYLDGEGVTHRDIKPDNLGVRRLANQAKRLVLFDFSLAGTDVRNVTSGTPGYLDPFLGTPQRPTYDAHAEWYAVAVTLHELASGELPVWGDGQTEPRFTKGEPRIATEAFDAALREELSAFFRRALHRNARKRFATLQDMKAAWLAVFHQVDTEPPVTTVDEETTAEARDAAATAATRATPLDAAGLTPRAVSAAQRLGTATVGDLLDVPAKQLWTLRGLGAKTRQELLRRARSWRERLGVGERPPTRASDGRPTTRAEDGAGPADLLATLSLDAVIAELLPRRTTKNEREREIVRLVLGLPDDSGQATALLSWPSRRQVAERFGITGARVTHVLATARKRWQTSPVVRSVREELVALLEDSGRLLGLAEAADAVLLSHGSTRTGSALRHQLGVASVRAVIEADSAATDKRLAFRRHGDRVVIALECREGDDPRTPTSSELLDYADRLGAAADRLAASDPLPSAASALRTLRQVRPIRDSAPLTERRLVLTAVSAAQNAEATPRLEVYPRDLDPVRALRLTQAGFATDDGITAGQVQERVRARFPALGDLPTGARLGRLLNEAGFDLVLRDGRYAPRDSAVSSGTSITSRLSTAAGGFVAGEHMPAVEAERRLSEASVAGGFRALTVGTDRAVPALGELRRFDVEPVNVTTAFITALRSVAADVGITDWSRVDQTDRGGPTHPEHHYLRDLVARAWARLRLDLLGQDSVSLLLHDAGPMVRYFGLDLLEELANAARSTGLPRGLWLLCPQQDPDQRPRLDGSVVPIVTENEWIALPDEWVANKHRGVAGVAS